MKNILVQFGKLLYTNYYFPFELICLELIFKLSCNEFISIQTFFYSLFFSIGAGMMIEFLTGLIPHKKTYFIIRGFFSLAISVPYMVLYFIFCKFHVYYDLNTVFSGASDATGDFSGDIKQLIFCVNGIGHILLFLIPFILMIILILITRNITFEFYFKRKLLYKLQYMAISGSILIFLLLAIRSDENYGKYLFEEYHYETAVAYYGVFPAMILDAKNSASFEKQHIEFEFDSIPDSQLADATIDETTILETDSTGNPLSDTLPEETTEEIIQPKDIAYGLNVLPIDFDALALDASSDLSKLDSYVASLTGTSKNQYTGLFKGKNLIFITAEAFTEEVIDPDLTPTLYRLATKGIQVTDFYQPSSAGTTGGEYSNIMGMLPTDGGSSMKKTADHYNYMTIGNLLNNEGYYGMAYHNNSYTFYDRDKTHVNLGYSNGFMGKGNGMEEYLSNVWPESDLEMMECTVSTYLDKQPFNIYYMTVSGHSLYTFRENAMAKKHKEEVDNLEYSDSVKAYYACQLELESAMAYLVNELEKAGIANDTVIVISADHFPYGLDVGNNLPNLTEWYGAEINNNFERDHNRLIIWSGCLEEMDPIIVDAPTFSPDILPTLCNLFGIEYDSRLLVGRDILSDAPPIIFSLGYDWKTDLGTYIASKNKFTPVSEDVEIPEDYVKEINRIVKNKITYMKGVLNYDYYRHVFETN